MNVQVSLKNEAVAPWKDLGCSESCWNAKEERCECRCGGKFHGFGNSEAKKPKVVQEVVEEVLEC